MLYHTWAQDSGTRQHCRQLWLPRLLNASVSHTGHHTGFNQQAVFPQLWWGRILFIFHEWLLFWQAKWPGRQGHTPRHFPPVWEQSIQSLTPPRKHSQLKAIFSRWEARETTKLPASEASIPNERIPEVVQKVMNINSAAILFTS